MSFSYCHSAIPKIIYFITLAFSAFMLYSCSASTDTRYSKDAESKIDKNEEKSTLPEDDFDIEPFKTKIVIPNINKPIEPISSELWFGYPDSSEDIQTGKTVTDTIAGYRVQVISTDNLDEANGVRSEIYFKTNEKAVYVIFEPPFYVVRVGDYNNINDAQALSFKLSQMGYAGTKVVTDQINVFK